MEPAEAETAQKQVKYKVHMLKNRKRFETLKCLDWDEILSPRRALNRSLCEGSEMNALWVHHTYMSVCLSVLYPKYFR